MENNISKKLKLHKSIDEQVNLLKSRNLIIEDENEAKSILSKLNYYRLDGYLFNFKQKGSENFIPGTSFKKVLRIYGFDSKLNTILMYALEDIEETLKTRFSYTLSSNFPKQPLIYCSSKVYMDEKQFSKFKQKFKETVSNNRGVPFVRHHIENYNGKFPVWVAVELMTLGMLDSLYKNLKPVYKKGMAKCYHTSPVILENWIENIRYTRNHLAHCMRIYKYNFGRIPMSCSNHPINAVYKGKIFDQIAIISNMFSNKYDWNNYVLDEILKLMNEYKDVVLPEDLGMPENWHEVLKK